MPDKSKEEFRKIHLEEVSNGLKLFQSFCFRLAFHRSCSPLSVFWCDSCLLYSGLSVLPVSLFLFLRLFLVYRLPACLFRRFNFSLCLCLSGNCLAQLAEKVHTSSGLVSEALGFESQVHSHRVKHVKS